MFASEKTSAMASAPHATLAMRSPSASSAREGGDRVTSGGEADWQAGTGFRIDQNDDRRQTDGKNHPGGPNQ